MRRFLLPWIGFSVVACFALGCKPAGTPPKNNYPEKEPADGKGADQMIEPVVQDWDFYMSRINDEPASVRVNLYFRSKAPLSEYPTLAWVFLKMPDPADHGMGTGESAKVMNPIEDALVKAITSKLRGHHVCRIRGQADWQLYFYLPETKGDDFAKTVHSVMQSWPEQKYLDGFKSDPEWKDFFHFMAPDDERMQWIMDRRVIDQLKESGDDHSKARPIEHFLYFPTSGKRDSFCTKAAELGFRIKEKSESEEGPFKHTTLITRTQAVDLDAIHAEVMQLIKLARSFEGQYDGWGCNVEK